MAQEKWISLRVNVAENRKCPTICII